MKSFLFKRLHIDKEIINEVLRFVIHSTHYRLLAKRKSAKKCQDSSAKNAYDGVDKRRRCKMA